MLTLKYSIASLALMLLAVSSVAAQSTVTFNLNLKPQLEDSLFIPGRDFVEIKGDGYPLNMNSNRLTDTAPRDSIYSITLRFARSDLNKNLDYSYILHVNGEQIRENMSRSIRIQPGEHDLDALHFNSFAW